jgi:hypothetical protein
MKIRNAVAIWEWSEAMGFKIAQHSRVIRYDISSPTNLVSETEIADLCSKQDVS